MICLFSAAIVPGCEDEFPPPPPATQPAAVEPPIDLKHSIQFKADRVVIIPNIVLVLQSDPGGMAISLTASRTSSDGMSVLFGEFVREARPEKLVGLEITLRSGKMYTPTGNLVRTPMAVYKPREAVMKITSVSQGEATGTISGAFYRFAAPQSGITRPTELNAEASFTARLIIR